MNNPVGINVRSNGCSVTGSLRLARRSMPAERPVAYAGSGCADWFTMRMEVITLLVGDVHDKRYQQVAEHSYAAHAGQDDGSDTDERGIPVEEFRKTGANTQNHFVVAKFQICHISRLI